MSKFNLKVYFLRYFYMYFTMYLLGHDSNKLINSVEDFSGFNFIFFFRACNVASMMAVTKSELGGQMFNEQFCMYFCLVIIACTTFYYMCCIVF